MTTHGIVTHQLQASTFTKVQVALTLLTLSGHCAPVTIGTAGGSGCVGRGVIPVALGVAVGYQVNCPFEAVEQINKSPLVMKRTGET